MSRMPNKRQKTVGTRVGSSHSTVQSNNKNSSNDNNNQNSNKNNKTKKNKNGTTNKIRLVKLSNVKCSKKKPDELRVLHWNSNSIKNKAEDCHRNKSDFGSREFIQNLS